MYNSRLCTVLFYMLTYHRTAYSSYCFFQIFYLWNGTIRYDAAQRDVHTCSNIAQGLTTRDRVIEKELLLQQGTVLVS